jgi:hypothetical protein
VSKGSYWEGPTDEAEGDGEVVGHGLRQLVWHLERLVKALERRIDLAHRVVRLLLRRLRVVLLVLQGTVLRIAISGECTETVQTKTETGCANRHKPLVY